MTDPVVGVALDDDLLSEVVGRRVTASRLRPKPGVSCAAALTPADHPDHADQAGQAGQEGVWGWVWVLRGPALAKAGNAVRRAERLGVDGRLGRRCLPEHGCLVMWGPMDVDPRLSRPLHGLGLPIRSVLRYNPLRRIVFRHGDRVVRVTADEHRDRLADLCADLHGRDVPVLRALPGPELGGRSRQQVSWWPWIAAGRVQDRPGAPLLARVGTALGRLHRADPAGLAVLPERSYRDQVHQAATAVRQLRLMAPAAAGPAVRALTLLPPVVAPSPTVLSHGDFSLDQCLVSDHGHVLLADLDRACLAPAALDLAELCATMLIDEGPQRTTRAGDDPGSRVRTGATLASGIPADLGPVQDAYRQTTGSPPDVAPAWVAAAILTRVSEPWRSQRSGWEVEARRRGLLAERLLEAGMR